MGLRDGVGALHLRHPDAAHRARGAALASSSAPRRRSSTRSCFDANGGVFEVLFGAEDAIISRRAQPRLDHRRHPAVQGRRGTGTGTPTWPTCARSSRRPGRGGARAGVVVTDGVFSMDGSYAPLDEICDLADEFERAWCSSTTRTPWASSATAAAARPSCSGSWTASTSSPARSARRSAAPRAATSRAHQEVVDLLRQRSRPYLFSNSVAPAVVAGSLAALELVDGLGRGARDAARQHRAVPRADDGGRVRAAARARTRSRR